MRSLVSILALFFAVSGFVFSAPLYTLRYSHPNEPDSAAGLQASFFASKVREYTKGAVVIELYPSSQMGSLEGQLALTRSGRIDINHATAAAIGSVYEDYTVLDTPYLFRDVDYLLRVADPSSPIMQRLADGLLKSAGLRLLYTFYFGTRQLTCDRPVRRPEDLEGVSVRSIPFPMYSLAVESLGARPVPIDWSNVRVALATRAIAGQENPLNIILTSHLYDFQAYLMPTEHQRSIASVVINEGTWQGLPAEYRAAIMKAAGEASRFATKATLTAEASDLATLVSKGMKVIGPAEGLDRGAFEARARRLVAERYGAKWADYYRMIEVAK